MNNKKILFVCNYYAPDATIAAIRTTKFVKYLCQYGYDVDFLSVKNDGLSKDEILSKDAEGVCVTYSYNSKRFLAIEKFIKRLLNPAKQKRMMDFSNRNRINPKTGHIEFYPFETAYPIIGSIEYVLNICRQKDYFRGIKSWIDRANSYDFMITSYGDAYCYYVGRYYHKTHPDTKWIFDIRDSIYRYKFTPKYVGFISIIMEHRVWKEADAIVGVSKGICNRVPQKYRDKVHIITNGYDLTDRNEHKESKTYTKKLILTFTGSMYGGLYDLTPLFSAIYELAKEGKIDKKNIEIHFAGTKSAEEVFHRQLKNNSLEETLISHGKISRRETLILQEKSDLLLAPSYDYENNKGGIITGKIFEYMSARRPVVVIVTGDINKSEIADITRKCNIGVAYEQAHHNHDYEELKLYIMNAYLQKRENDEVSYDPNEHEIKKFDYRNLTKRMIDLMKHITQEDKIK